MVEWLAGNRIRGTSTERTSTSGFNTVVGLTGGWKELGRTTLGSEGDSIDVGTITGKRYLMFLSYISDNNGSITPSLRFNNDSSGTNGSSGNYSHRSSSNGGNDWNTVSQTQLRYGAGTSNTQQFNVATLANKSDKEKLMYSHMAYTQDGTLYREETAGKWANTSAQITDVELVNTNTGSFDSDNEMVVLGWDEDDTHTTNFWEELASVDLSGGTATSLSSGTFTSKKYLMVQWFCERSGSGDIQPVLQVGTGGSIDNGQNYPMRLSQNGGSEFTSSLYRGYSVWGSSNQRFETMFIINQSNKEKLCISHGAGNNSTGQVDPDRTEFVGKWTNTSGQINIVSLKDQDEITLGNATQMKVWGSD